MENDRRADDKALAIFIQRFDDFERNTEKYRRSKEEIDKKTADTLERTTAIIYEKLDEMKLSLAKLPCDSHMALAN